MARLIFRAAVLFTCLGAAPLFAEVRIQDVMVLEDSSADLGIEDALLRDEQFRPVRSIDRLNFGITASAYWLRFDIRGTENEAAFLRVGNAVLYELDLYRPRPDGGYSMSPGGVMTPRADREFQYIQPVFELPGDGRYYLRIHSDTALWLSLNVEAAHELHAALSAVSGIILLIGGMGLAIVVYNLIIFGLLRDPGYAWIALTILCFVLYQLTLAGVSSRYLWPHSPFWSGHAVIVFAGGVIVFILQFTRNYLGTERFGRLELLFRLMMILTVLNSLYGLADYRTANRLFAWIGLAATAVILGTALALMRRERPARIFLLAWLPAFSGAVVYVLLMLDLVPYHFFIRYAMSFGVLAGGFSLSYALADRLIEVRRRYSDHLEATVRSRTRELEEAVVNLEAARRQAEEASRSKSAFLANMSHEIRTPMNAILGAAALLDETPSEEERRRYVRLLEKAGTTLLALIDDILDLSRVEAGRLVLDESPFDPVTVLEAVTEIMELRAREKGLQLRIVVSPGLPRSLLGDSLRLRQILLNLVGNAVKFTESGRIEAGVRLVPGDSDEETSVLEYHVADTGPGIPEKQQRSVFESFQQADVSVTRRYGGSGLGLAISNHLVRLMNGQMKLESEEGRGSVFRFTARFRNTRDLRTEPDGGTRLPVPAATIPECRILLVEDNPDNRLLIEAYLRRTPVHLESAFDGADALRILIEESRRFDLVFMDLQMPVLDGLSTTRRFRDYETEHDVRRTPIVALTAHALPEERERAAAAGCDDYLTKPVKKSDLLDMILKHVPEGGET